LGAIDGGDGALVGSSVFSDSNRGTPLTRWRRFDRHPPCHGASSIEAALPGVATQPLDQQTRCPQRGHPKL